MNGLTFWIIFFIMSFFMWDDNNEEDNWIDY